MKFVNNLIYIVLAIGSTLFAFKVLSTLYTTTIESPDGQSFGVFANSVSSIGDLNNDGYSEFIVGAPEENPNGRAYIFNGANYDTLFSVTQSQQNVIDFGISVSGAGDVNNDGINDFIVGSDYHANQMAFVYSSATGDTLFGLSSPLAMFNGGGFGRVVSDAGDVNNDGYDDVLIGASEEFPFGLNRAGRAYIFSGATGDTIRTLVSPDTAENGYFGIAVAAIGDINNDNFDDVIVGAYNQSISTFWSAGQAYIFSGSDGDTLFALKSSFPQNAGNFGYSVSGAGDVNNDGTNDIIVGARQESVGGLSVSGRAYVFSGSSGQVLYVLSSPYPISYGYFGHSVTGVGDMNNDNYDDVFVGAFHEGVLGIARSGRGYIFSGATGDTLCSLQSLNPEQDGRFGWTASSGDFNNDGIGDIIVGAVGEVGGYPNSHGRAYLYSTNPLSGIENEIDKTPQKFVLNQNYPNPFNPTTTIRFSLFTSQHVSLKIFNVLGKKVATLIDDEKSAGDHRVEFNAAMLASGVYYRLQVDDLTQTKRLVLLR